MDNKNINNNEQATQETPHPYRKDMSFAQRTRDRKIRWLVLSIIFTFIFLRTLYEYICILASVPLYYNIPALLPTITCWTMFIGVTKINSINKDGYQAARVFAIIMIIIGIFWTLFTLYTVFAKYAD